MCSSWFGTHGILGYLGWFIIPQLIQGAWMFNVHPAKKSRLVKIIESGWWFSHLFGEDSQFDEHIFQRGWFNHQPDADIKMN